MLDSTVTLRFPLRRLAWLPAAGARALGAAAQSVQPPPLWYAGDTHEMIQLCPVAGGAIPPDRELTDVYAEMLAKDLHVMDVLVLVTGTTTCWQYLGQYAPLVTGTEDPLTLPDPEHVIQFGCEVVGGDEEGCLYPSWGHVVGLGIEDAAYPFEADYPAPSLAFFRAQPKGVVGYAHVAWPEGLAVPADFPPIDRNFTRIYPLLAPFDVALRRVDFLSTPDVGHQAVQITRDPWWGLWYKLLDAGLRVSVTGGTVAQCYVALGSLDARTYARIALDPLDHDRWLRAIQRGRTTLADGAEDFLDLEVEGALLGTTLQASSPAVVSVEATLTTTAARQTVLEVLLDGEVVASEPVDLPLGGQHVLRAEIPVPESGWLAARTLPAAHTGAIFVLVDGKPIVDAETADYFAAFADHLDAFLDDAVRLCESCAGSGCAACTELERWVGESEAEIRADIESGRRIFRALAAYDRPPPGSAERYGRSTPSCVGPLGIGLAAPALPGAGAHLTCFNGPPSTTGALVVGSAPNLTGVPYLGATLHVSQVPAPMTIPVTTDEGGYAEVRLRIPPATAADELYCQFLLQDTPNCPSPGTLCASDALRVPVPRNLYLPSTPR